MKIIADFTTPTITKPELEQVEKEKMEYKLIDTYLRTPGLKLWSYNSLKDELKQIIIAKKETLVLEPDEFGKLKATGNSNEETNVDGRNIHFEAVSHKSATNRIKKYKDGKIKELCNLRKPSKNGLKLW